MQILDTLYFGNTLRAWIIALSLAIGLPLTLGVVRAVLIRRLRKLASRTRTHFDDTVVDVLGHTKMYFLLFLGVWAAARTVALPHQADTILRYLAVLAIVMQAGSWANVAINAFLHRRMRLTLEQDPAAATTLSALGLLIRIALWSLLLLAALQNLGIEVGPLLTGLGVGGIAVALALQNILGDLFASLSIVLDKPFVLGDFIIVDDLMGTIENGGAQDDTRTQSFGRAAHLLQLGPAQVPHTQLQADVRAPHCLQCGRDLPDSAGQAGTHSGHDQGSH